MHLMISIILNTNKQIAVWRTSVSKFPKLASGLSLQHESMTKNTRRSKETSLHSPCTYTVPFKILSQTARKGARHFKD